MRKILGTCLFVFALSGFGLVSTAYAQDDESSTVARQVETLSVEGAQHFAAGDFEAAIVSFQEAYALQPVPNLLYNIGRCHEQLEQWDQAIVYLERFITAPEVESDAREHAMQRVQSLREIKEATARGDDDPDTGDLDDDPMEPEPVVVEGPNRTPGFIAVGAGAGLIVGGVVMGLMASGNANTIQDTTLSYDDRLAAQSSARTQGLVADIFYVSGAAVTAVGIYLLVTAGSDDAPPPTAATIQPWIGRHSAGVGFGRGF